MSRSATIGLALVALGAIASAPGVILVGSLTILTSWLTTLWSHRGLRRVTYERRLPRDRALPGDRVEVRLTVHNDKLLPLAWLQAEDFVSEGTERMGSRHIERSDRPGLDVLRTIWTLAPYERVTRHLWLDADHRGLHRFGPVRLEVADLFGRESAVEEHADSAVLLVRPRSVPVRVASPETAPLGLRRARSGLHEDPALFAGVRPFQPGDPRKRIHWRASARLGQPVSKRFEPATLRESVVVLDAQTAEGPFWMMAYEEDVLEGIVIAAASICRAILGEGGACGLAVNAWTATTNRTALVAPTTGDAQLARIDDTLARMSSYASAPFENLVATLPMRVGPGTTILTLSSRDPRGVLASERRLAASGYAVTHVAYGPRRTEWAAMARRVGISAMTAGLDGDWRTSGALELAS
jgi:uncharacterized protein (DUF58 family)